MTNTELFPQIKTDDHILTGFNTLDEILLGYRPGELIVIAGYDEVGKTAFALNLVRNISIKNKITTALFSLDLTNEIVMRRLSYMGALVDNMLVSKGNLSDREKKKLANESRKIESSPLYLFDSILSINSICNSTDLLVAEKDVNLVIIDYLQLIQPAQYVGDSLQETVSVLSALKQLAVESNIPVIVISNFSRDPNPKSYYYPSLDDFEYRNVFEQMADVILFVHRPWIYTLKEDERNTAKIIIEKNRKGGIGLVLMKFTGCYIRFEDLN